MEEYPETIETEAVEFYPASFRDPVEDEQDIPDIFRRLGSLKLDDEDSALREHQKEAFEDVVDFYATGGRECYVKMPTSSGKTVLFVTLTKKLFAATPEGQPKPKVIVLEPTIDLVEQTVGSVDEETGKKRGFKGFAPELDVRPFHGRLRDKERRNNLVEADVLVSTNNSFRNIIYSFNRARSHSPSEWQAERNECEAWIITSKLELKALAKHKAASVINLYKTQEVDDARKMAEVLLIGHGRNTKPNARVRHEIEVLETIRKIANTPQVSSASYMHIKNVIGNAQTEGTRKALGLLHDMYYLLPKVKDIKSVDEALEMDQEDGVLGNTGSYQGVVKATNLNDYEEFIMSFLWRNKSSSKLNIGSLRHQEDRNQILKIMKDMDSARYTTAYMRRRVKSIDYFQDLLKGADNFDLVYAMKFIGASVQDWGAITSYTEERDIALLGATATDEYEDRSIEDYFESKAHELTSQEAIRRKITNPTAIFVHRTGLDFNGVELDRGGDYSSQSIRSMIYSEARNILGVQYARTLSEHGYSGLMPGIAGENGLHAKILADLINQTTMLDPVTGELRQMRARYVLGSTPKELRAKYYHQFEHGELDWLTSIDVMREGWDSDTAKALINMRPTRSLLLATQRLGRIGRTYPSAPVSVCIDLYDQIRGIEDAERLPAALASDVFEVEDVEQGFIIGGSEDEEVPDIINVLRESMRYKIDAPHTKYGREIQDAYEVDGRGIAIRGIKQTLIGEWQTLDSIRKGYVGFLPRELVTSAAEAEIPQVRSMRGRKGSRLVTLYNVSDLLQLYEDKPMVDAWKLFTNDHGSKRITSEGITKLLSKKIPTLDIDEINEASFHLEAETSLPVDRDVVRVPIAFGESIADKWGLTYSYSYDEVIERLVPYLEKRHTTTAS